MKTNSILIILIIFFQGCVSKNDENSVWIGKLYDNVSIILEIKDTTAIITSITSWDWDNIEENKDTFKVDLKVGSPLMKIGDLHFDFPSITNFDSLDSIVCKIQPTEQKISFYRVKTKSDVGSPEKQLLNNNYNVYNWLNDRNFRFNFFEKDKMLMLTSNNNEDFFQIFYWKIISTDLGHKILIIGSTNTIEMYPIVSMHDKEIDLISLLGGKYEKTTWVKIPNKYKKKMVFEELIGNWTLYKFDGDSLYPKLLPPLPPYPKDTDSIDYLSNFKYVFNSDGSFEYSFVFNKYEGYWSLSESGDIIKLITSEDNEIKDRRELLLIKHIDKSQLVVRLECSWPLSLYREFYTLEYRR